MVNKGKCYKCGSFLRYYTRGRIQFNETKYGWCGTRLCSVMSTDSCCQFKHKMRTKNSRDSLRIYLSHLLTEISAIKLLLEEERDENL